MPFLPSLSTTSYVRLVPESEAASAPLSTSSSLPPTRTLYFTYTRLPSSSSSEPPSNDPEPQVWTNLPSSSCDAREWHSIPFLFTQTRALSPLLVATIKVPLTRVREGDSFEFTYRLKHRDGGIEWIGSQGGNGTISFVARDSLSKDEDPTFSVGDGGQGGDWTSEGNGKVLIGKFKTRPRDEQGISRFDLTKIVEKWIGAKRQVEGMTLEQSSRTWFTPRLFSPDTAPLSQLSPVFVSQLLLLRALPSAESPLEEKLLVVFPFSSHSINSSLIGGQGKELYLRCERDGPDNEANSKQEGGGGGGVVFVTSSNKNDDTFDSLIKLAVSSASRALYPSRSTPPVSEPRSLSPPKDISLCTWNALGPGFTFSSLLSYLDEILSPESTEPGLVESFKRGGIMLDDGWQETENFKGQDKGEELRGLRGFGVRDGWYDLADRGGEEGRELELAVEMIKERGIERVGVWMTITGYWNCLHPDFRSSENFPLTLATFSSPQHDSFHFTAHVPTLSSLRSFFVAYFDRIHSAGISFVKIDNQALVDSLVSLSDGTCPGTYRSELLSVIQQESSRTFGRENVVHCMAHSTRIWSGPLALSPSNNTNHPSSLRNSDDYFPNERDSHRWHAWINSVNLLLTRQFVNSFDPDLDMAQEQHEWGSFHLSLRAFSTARVWCTDSAGQAGGVGGGEGRLGEKERGWKGLLATHSSDGKAKVVQAREQAGCILPGQVLSREVTQRNERGGEALKVGSSSTRAKGATIGMWNCQQDGGVGVALSRRDVWELVRSWEPKEDLIVIMDESFGPTPSSSSTMPLLVPIEYKYLTSDSLSPSLSLPLAAFELPPRTTRLATVAELHTLQNSRGSLIHVACLGLRDKFVGIEAIRRAEIVTERNQANEPKEEEDEKARNKSLPTRMKPSATCSSSSSHAFPSPPPGTHVPFLLHYFSNLFSPRNRSISSSSLRVQTPASELSSLFRSLLRKPISTIIREVRGIFTFGVAVVVWAWKTRRNSFASSASVGGGGGGADSTIANVSVLKRKEDFRALEEGSNLLAPRSSDEDEKHGRESTANVFRTHLDFISPRLGFYFSKTRASDSFLSRHDVEIKFEGKIVEEKHLRWIEELGVVEVDAETVWKDSGKPIASSADGWVIQVAYKG